MIQSRGQLSFLKRASRVVLLITTAMLLSAAQCGSWPPKIGGLSGGYVSPSNAAPSQAYRTTANLADRAQSACKGTPNESAGNEAAKFARAAADNLSDAMLVYGYSSDMMYSLEIRNAMDAAAKVARQAYEQAKACGGVPPEIPNIPGYSETFWDISS